MSRVLLLNPPWEAPILRDYWCTSVSKAGYLWHPIELLAQTGWLHSQGIAYQVIDAIAERLSDGECLRRVAAYDPSVVLLLTSPLSQPEDDAFMSNLGGRTLVVSGEAACADPEGYLAEHPRVEAVLLDFTSDALVRYIAGGREGLRGLYLRGDGKRGTERFARRPRFRMPVPRHADFPVDSYRLPLLGGSRFATLMTDLGCPFHCRFCNSGASGHRLRRRADITEELRAIANWGYEHVFVKDMCFGAVREHALEVCSAFQGRGLTWHAYVRADCLDRTLVEAMAGSGCRLVQIGIESGDRRLRLEYGKDLDDTTLEATFGECRRVGMKVGGHFVLDLPRESPATVLRTYRLASRLRPDYVSFNIATVRRGSTFARRGSSRLDPLPDRWMLAARNLMYLAYYSEPRWLLQVLREAHWKDWIDLAVSGAGLLRFLARPMAELRWLRRMRETGSDPSRREVA